MTTIEALSIDNATCPDWCTEDHGTEYPVNWCHQQQIAPGVRIIQDHVSGKRYGYVDELDLTSLQMREMADALRSAADTLDELEEARK